MQVSYESSSVELDDQDRFPNFFRVIPSDAEFPTVFNAILQQYGWKRVAILTQNEGIFTEVNRIFVLHVWFFIPILFADFSKTETNISRSECDSTKQSIS